MGLFADGSFGEGWSGVPGPVRGLLFGDAGQLAAQAVGVVTNALVVFSLAFGFFYGLERLMGNRVSPDVEWSGLDESEMGAQAYTRD